MRVPLSGIILPGVLPLLLAAQQQPGTAVAERTGRASLVATVSDRATGAPVPNAEILMPDLAREARTDSLGEARITGIPSGTFRVRIKRLGYGSAETPARFEADSVRLLFRLAAVSVSLDTVRVVAKELQRDEFGFAARRRQGIGRFLTDSDLARSHGLELGAVVAMHFPGLSVVHDATGRAHLNSAALGGAADPRLTSPGKELCEFALTSTGMTGGGAAGGISAGSAGNAAGASGGRGGGAASSTTGGGGGGGGMTNQTCGTPAGCPVQVYLNDIYIGEEDFDLIRSEDLVGAEYYTGANQPPQYRRSGAACGVLLLWSRASPSPT